MQVLHKIAYDGVIYTNVDGVHEYVAFESNQFKNITNKAPTKSADIRYSHRSGVDKYTLKEYNNYGWARATLVKHRDWDEANEKLVYNNSNRILNSQNYIRRETV